MEKEELQVLSTKQAADMVGVHKNTILNWIRTGKVPDVKRDWKGYRLWKPRDIENLMKMKHHKRQLELGLWSVEE